MLQEEITTGFQFFPFGILLLSVFASAIYFILSLTRAFPSGRSWIGLSVILAGINLLVALIIFLYIPTGSSLSYQIPWISWDGKSTLYFSLLLSPISLLMGLMVTFIAFLVQIFSLSYMSEERAKGRYFSFLHLFVVAMLGIVYSGNLLQIFVFWELVGLCSFFLIGFWNEKEVAAKAANKAFIVNRIADAGFVLGLGMCWMHFGTFEIKALQLTGIDLVPASILIPMGIGFLLGAMGKSAQFPFQIWLPDAMQGPSPVSALIHAATMVAAGIYLLARIHFLLPLPILDSMIWLGAVTAFMGAFAAWTSYDIKRVLAFSTISQLGFMLIGMGTSFPASGMFHLITHAFFKAGLFLIAGAIIHHFHHALNHDKDAQDMRNMYGLSSHKWLMFSYLICAAALMGLPFFSGFLSKESILLALWDWSQESNSWLPLALAFFTVAFTAFYMSRQAALLFASRPEQGQHAKTGHFGWQMILPILLLSGLSLFTLVSWQPLLIEAWLWTNLNLEISLARVNPLPHHVGITFTSIGMVILGALFGYRKGLKEINTQFQQTNHWLFRLADQNWMMDILHEKFTIKGILKGSKSTAAIDKGIDQGLIALVKTGVVIGHISAWWDFRVIDGTVNTLATASKWLGQKLKGIQSGNILAQLRWLWVFLLGLLLLVIW